MRLRQIEDFVAVVESGSIRAAARKLGLSQPAITKSMRRLEVELKSQLLQRTPRGVVPTPSGRAFFARARAAQAELRKAEEEVSQIGGGGAGSVAFGVVPAAIPVVPQAVVRFRQQFPRARLRILEGYTHTLLPLVRDETLDMALGVRFDPNLDPALTFRPLFRFEYAVVARKGHPLRSARSLAELADSGWISLTPSGSPGGPLDRAFSSAGLPEPHQMVRCESHNIAVAMLAKTDMVGIMSRRMLSDPLTRDFIHEIAVGDAMPSYTVGIFARADPPLTPFAAAMAKAATAAARELASRAS
ncbi:MAG TPA: LysR substrate-binding domain-containing protein [Burkholderiales bacterium]|nr:LysR substrate-binding domain-containing protein [Burkholderiales bacterium]